MGRGYVTTKVESGFVVRIGGRGQVTNPPLYLIDTLEVSSLLKDRIFEKAAQLYADGQPLRSISQTLEIPRTTIRDTLVDRGVALRQRGKCPRGYVRGTAPYGYVVIAGKLVEDPREQQVLQRILSMWRSGKTFHAIAETLNGQGVRPRRALSWKYASIQKIVRRHPTN